MIRKQVRDRKQKGEIERSMIERDAKKKKALKDVGQDTKIKLEIHGIISGEIRDGKSKEEIIKELSIPRYEKYEDFLDSWIEDGFNKRKTNINRNFTR